MVQENKNLNERTAVLENRADSTEEIIQEIRNDIKIILAQSNQWAGIRKGLGVLVGVIAPIVALLTGLAHYFWPYGDLPKH